MKTLKQLIEVWEHPFSGKDYFDDDEGLLNSLSRSKYSKPNETSPEINELSNRLRDHYSSIAHPASYTLNKDEKDAFSDYVGGESYDMNKLLISKHKNPGKDVGWHHFTRFTPKNMLEHADNAWGDIDPIAKETHEILETKINSRIENLHSVLSKIKTPHDMHVYTGIGFHPVMMSQGGQNKKFGLHIPTFLSTTIRPKIAINFAKEGFYNRFDPDYIPKKHLHITAPSDKAYFNSKIAHIMKIHIPEGSAGVYAGASHDDSNYGRLRTTEREFILPKGSKLIVGGKSSKLHHVYNDGYDDEKPKANPILEKRIHVWHAKLVHDGFDPTRHMDEFK